MKKSLLLIAALLVTANISFSQELLSENSTKADSLRIGWWDKSSQVGANFTGAQFNDNWQGGGSNNFGLGLFFNGNAIKTKGKGVWANDLQLQYAFVKNEDLPTSRKSMDRIFAESKYSRSIKKSLYWFTGASFITQFAKGYDYGRDVEGVTIEDGVTTGEAGYYSSNLFAPAYLNIATGIEWMPKPFFSVSFGPIAYKGTYIFNDDVLPVEFAAKEARYGVANGKSALHEFGSQLVTVFNKEIVPNVNVNWRQQFFKAYRNNNKLDYRSDLLVSAKVNKYINVNASWIAIFDEDMIPVEQRASAKNLWQSSTGFNVGLLVNL